VNFVSLFSGGGGFDLGLENAGMQCVGQVEIMPYALKVLSKQWPSVPKHTDIQTLCVEDGLAKTIQSLAQERVQKVLVPDCGEKCEDCSHYSDLVGLSEKMFPDFSLLEMEKTSGQSLPTSIRSGIVWRGMLWTADFLAWPNNVKECSLSQVLETQVPQKYFLSEKAIHGIIRRSKKWGRGGYVFLQETANDKTQQLKLLSVPQLEQMMIDADIEDLRNQTSSPLTQSIPIKEGNHTKPTLKPSLRRLTPNEKEKLQGFPLNWTLCEE
jgi:site-specific DNA-cytosine methylase